MTINVCNKHHGVRGEYIGRGSPLGNPFTHIPSGTKAQTVCPTRDAACDAYEAWLQDHIDKRTPAIMQELGRLYILSQQGDLNLICFCAPKRCHGDTIKRILMEG